MTTAFERHLRRALLVAWAAIVTITMQSWIGGATIYRAEYAERVAMAHRAIVANRPPDGVSWTAAGLNSTNIRVGVPFAVEALSRSTGVGVIRLYRLVDTAALFAALVLLAVLLRRIVDPVYAALGALAFASVLPLTYQLFYYHPWDRVSLINWIVLLLLAERQRIGWFAAMLPVAIAVKFDVILLPGLILLMRAPISTRLRDHVRPLALCAGLFAVSFGTYWLLRFVRPGGFEPVARGPLFQHNLEALRELNIAYPPFLGFALLIPLAVYGLRSGTRFTRACVVFAFPLLGVFLLQSRFEEFRCEVPVFLMLLPSALIGLRDILGTGSRAVDASEGSLARPPVAAPDFALRGPAVAPGATSDRVAR